MLEDTNIFDSVVKMAIRQSIGRGPLAASKEFG